MYLCIELKQYQRISTEIHLFLVCNASIFEEFNTNKTNLSIPFKSNKFINMFLSFNTSYVVAWSKSIAATICMQKFMNKQQEKNENRARNWFNA